MLHIDSEAAKKVLEAKQISRAFSVVVEVRLSPCIASDTKRSISACKSVSSSRVPELSLQMRLGWVEVLR